MIELLSDREILIIRKAATYAAETLHNLKDIIKLGITTEEIDDFVSQDCLRLGCKPATLGYKGEHDDHPPYPASCCISVNEVVCHGIPNKRKLQNGDSLNVDVTHIFDGYYGDTSSMFTVGEISIEERLLIDTCNEALNAAISVVKPGARVGDIGAAILEVITPLGFSVFENFVGHGIGNRFHMSPHIFHAGISGTGMRLQKGLCFTIEPIITSGMTDVILLNDGWTYVTKDGKRTAQYEHTLLVTSAGCDILTQLK